MAARTSVRSILESAAPSPVAAPPDSHGTAQEFGGLPSVGALFYTVSGLLTVHYCSAVVVHSTSGDLLMTAAHCVYDAHVGGFQDDFAFVPGYADTKDAHGIWVPTTIVVDRRWVDSADPDADVAFVQVRRADGGQGDLESLTGANSLRINPGFDNSVTVIGYPMLKDRPVSCAGVTSEQSPTQLRFACGGYSNGTSGGPFLTGIQPATGTGAVVGVIGGYQQGGDTDQVSYSAYPDNRIAALYQAAGGSV